MNSRLSKALRKLGKKCTPEGTQVTGDNVDGLLECIAEHYVNGGGSCHVKPIVAPDQESIVSFRELETGLYTFHGHFTPYWGSDVYSTAPYPVLASVINDGDVSYVQILFPFKNQVQYYEITDNSYESSSAKLAEYGNIQVSDFQKIMEYAARYSLDEQCKTLSEVLTELSEKVSFAKLVVNVTDSATGEPITYAVSTITGEEVWNDGKYHLKSGAYTLKVQSTGYSTHSETITVKSADVTAGEKVVDVVLVATT